MHRRLSRTSFFGALGVLGVPFWVPSPCTAADTFTLRLSISDPISSLLGVAASRFASAVNRRANGQLKIDVYPNGQLATQQGTVDALATGVIDFSMQSTTYLVPRFPRYEIFNMPFLFKDLAAGYRVLDGPIGDEFFAELESQGILGLAWGAGGFRQIETHRPVVVPDDLKGLRIRIQPGTVFVATFQALGAIPLVIDLSELYTALSQHAVDSLDVPLTSYTSGKFYTLVKHVAMSNHILAVEPLLGSKRKIEALPAPLQNIIKTEAKAYGPLLRSLTLQQIAEDIQILRPSGVTFTEIQYPAFRKAVDPVYGMLQSKLGGNVIERISRAAASSGRDR